MTADELCDKALHFLNSGTGACPASLVRELVTALRVAAAALKSDGERIEALEQAVAEREGDAVDAWKRIDVLSEKIEQQQQQIRDTEDVLTKRDGELQHCGELLAKSGREWADETEKTAELTEQLEAQQQQLKDAEAAVAARDQELSELRGSAGRIADKLRQCVEWVEMLSGKP